MKRFFTISALATAIITSCLSSPSFGQSASGSYIAARQAEGDRQYSIAADYYLDAIFFDPTHTTSQNGAIRTLLAAGDTVFAGELAVERIERGTHDDSGVLALIAHAGADEDFAPIVEVLKDVDLVVIGAADRLIRAWALLGAGDAETAIGILDQVAQEPGVRIFALYHKALALTWMGDHENALDAYNEISAVRGHNRRSALENAELLGLAGHKDIADRLLLRNFGLYPDPQVDDLRARLDKGGPFNITVSGPLDGMAELFYSVADVLNGDYVDTPALHYARVAQALRPNHSETLLLTADILEKLELHVLAREANLDIPKNTPEYFEAQLGIAETMRSSGDLNGALEQLHGLTNDYGRDPGLHTSIGDLSRQLGNYSGAIDAYSEAIDRMDAEDFQLWYVLYVRGIAYERVKDWPNADADFRRSLELRPGQPQVLNYLGYSLVERRENLDEALKLIELAVTAQPDNGYIVDSLGWVLYRLGKFEEAVVPMELAVKLMATDPIVNDHLGDVYWMVGRIFEAHFQWKRALSFDPEDAEADRIRRKLEVGLDVVLEEEADD